MNDKTALSFFIGEECTQVLFRANLRSITPGPPRGRFFPSLFGLVHRANTHANSRSPDCARRLHGAAGGFLFVCNGRVLLFNPLKLFRITALARGSLELRSPVYPVERLRAN